MVADVPSKASQGRIPFAVSLAVTLCMGLVYTALDVLQPAEPVFSLLAFAPGTISVLALMVAGLPRAELNLRLAAISLYGLAALAATTILRLPILGSTTFWIGWRWLPALAYAPASGIAQELYFRSALLPGLERAFNHQRTTALILHSVIFVGFHFRTFQAIPSLPFVPVVAVVLFLAGCTWAGKSREIARWSGLCSNTASFLCSCPCLVGRKLERRDEMVGAE